LAVFKAQGNWRFYDIILGMLLVLDVQVVHPVYAHWAFKKHQKYFVEVGLAASTVPKCSQPVMLTQAWPPVAVIAPPQAVVLAPVLKYLM
jgi:hypothetical protein